MGFFCLSFSSLLDVSKKKRFFAAEGLTGTGPGIRLG